MRIVDMRSDTITQPTPAMRQAMSEAKVGDDVFSEDPTVNRLEEMVSKRLGKEAALFVASGTMANLVSQLTHCGRGNEMILGDQSHMFVYEQGGSAALGGIHPRCLENKPDGTMALADIEAAIRPDDVHFPKTKLIVLENTHNRCSGSPLDVGYMRSVAELARRYGLKLHVDGARLFNATTALGVDAKDLVAKADSVSICLSKGLAAPVGSVVSGNTDFISEARRNRKVVGGGMRQAGILAAAGIVALTDMVDRLADDHENARKLAQGLVNMEGLSIDLDIVTTNIVFIDITKKRLSSQLLTERLHSRGIRLLPTTPNRLRAVTNYHVTSSDIDYALDIFLSILKDF
ncbi:MAG: low-specificity L-threonine aldolase [Desulfobacteraceae bacterium]|nr:low-specificity L-threonine aldolase [Desulfobacteraceae bacterium]MDH3572615.1 low-specificity L-threonine aldolase [Desulfobacteraceae bacterium]MDH3721295.1 low-specificity L-threonine aldolase [Desulfobacteraceae bacterium]MDH3835232.1 low-specificity L-threonine aldolase [Desulfobacteraceae bacterium]MDH3880863.1 low-specificity L-threonine aldolase [Desulfobacteraceae bacterium]